MQLEHIFAPGRLMQAVDILRDDRLQLALALQLRQAQVYMPLPKHRIWQKRTQRRLV